MFRHTSTSSSSLQAIRKLWGLGAVSPNFLPQTFAPAAYPNASCRFSPALTGNIAFFRRHLILRPQEISNNPEIIHRLGIISINTALEVDLFGNVNSTHLMGTQLARKERQHIKLGVTDNPCSYDQKIIL